MSGVGAGASVAVVAVVELLLGLEVFFGALLDVEEVELLPSLQPLTSVSRSTRPNVA
jgi:hypothetical protein